LFSLFYFFSCNTNQVCVLLTKLIYFNHQKKGKLVMYFLPLVSFIFLSMTACVDAMGNKSSDGEFIQLRNTTPDRKVSHRRLVERQKSLDGLPKVETGDVEGRSSTSTSPREKLRRDSANRIKEKKGAS
jgi:hypothetical protein